jgi:hypothetical protein
MPLTILKKINQVPISYQSRDSLGSQPRLMKFCTDTFSTTDPKNLIAPFHVGIMALPHDPATTPNLPQVDASSNTWDPSTISNVIFSAIMVFIGIIAIWQAHRAHRRSSRALDRGSELPKAQSP